MEPFFRFERVRREDLPLLHEWLNRPHVAEQWDGPCTLEQVIADWEPELDAPGVAFYIAHHEGRPVGYIQSYHVMSHPDFWPHERDPGAHGVDMFLANADQLGRGLGTAMLGAFVERLFADPSVTKIQIDPSPDNARAIRAYEKSGFRPQGVVDTPDGPALLMVLVRPARGPSGPAW